MTCKHNYEPPIGVPSDGCVACVNENAERALKAQDEYWKWRKKQRDIEPYLVEMVK